MIDMTPPERRIKRSPKQIWVDCVMRDMTPPERRRKKRSPKQLWVDCVMRDMTPPERRTKRSPKQIWVDCVMRDMREISVQQHNFMRGVPELLREELCL